MYIYRKQEIEIMTDTQNQTESKKKNFLFIGILSFLAVIILWLASWFFVYNHLPVWSERGAFGDMFGAVNALFSGLAFAGILIALYMQKHELELQREELSATREELKLQRMEMKGQKKQLEIQNKTSEKQRFENTFFQLLDVHHKIIIDLEHSGKDSRGGCQELYRTLSGEYKNDEERHKNENELINEAYNKLPKSWHRKINYCFGNLYTIINFVDKSQFDDKKFYSDIIRSQLSAYELVLLFYHGINKKDKEKFHPLVNSYSLLKNLDKSLLLDPRHENNYSDNAYR